jgi:hypothetical protein
MVRHPASAQPCRPNPCEQAGELLSDEERAAITQDILNPKPAAVPAAAAAAATPKTGSTQVGGWGGRSVAMATGVPRPGGGVQ